MFEALALLGAAAAGEAEAESLLSSSMTMGSAVETTAGPATGAVDVAAGAGAAAEDVELPTRPSRWTSVFMRPIS